MGEEYAEDAPFLYFVSHGDAELIEAVRQGRREEFATFDWTQEPSRTRRAADLSASRLQWETRTTGHHGVMLEFYRELIAAAHATSRPSPCPTRIRCDVLPLSAPGCATVAALAAGQPGPACS